MPRFRVELSTPVHVDVFVDAKSKQEAKEKWASLDDGIALRMAKSEVMDEATLLDDSDFDVCLVTEVSEDDENTPTP